MQWGLFYLPTELPDTPEGGANLYRTVIDQVRFCRGDWVQFSMAS